MAIDRGMKEHRWGDDQAAVAVENHARKIARFADDGGIAGAVEMKMHFFDQARDLVAQNLDGDGVQSWNHFQTSCFDRTRLRKPSTAACQPGGITVVASNCSTIAGPHSIAPGSSLSRR